MKKLLLIGALVGSSWTISSCSSSCTSDLSAFASATQSYSTTAASGSCAQINAAWSTLESAYNDLCEEQKQGIGWTGIQANHQAVLVARGC
jgi:hypothetical protein